MAAALASAASSIALPCLSPCKPVSSSSRPCVVVGSLPGLRKPSVSCSAACQRPEEETKFTASKTVLPSMAAAAASALMAASSPAAMALVDDRLSTEGTGLGLGVSNPLLVWILLGVFGLIWALFFAYTSTIPEGDDDSGLAL